MKITEKDLKNMFDKPKDKSMYLQEGHLNERLVVWHHVIGSASNI